MVLFPLYSLEHRKLLQHQVNKFQFIFPTYRKRASVMLVLFYYRHSLIDSVRCSSTIAERSEKFLPLKLNLCGFPRMYLGLHKTRLSITPQHHKVWKPLGDSAVHISVVSVRVYEDTLEHIHTDYDISTLGAFKADLIHQLMFWCHLISFFSFLRLASSTHLARLFISCCKSSESLTFVPSTLTGISLFDLVSI